MENISITGNLVTQSAHAYPDLLPHFKRMFTEIYAGNQYMYLIIQ